MFIFMGSDIKMGEDETKVYLSTLPSPDASSICKYFQTTMSGIYVVTMPEQVSVSSISELCGN